MSPSPPPRGPDGRAFSRQLSLLPLGVVLLLVAALASVAWQVVLSELQLRAQDGVDQRAAQLSDATERGLQAAVTSVRQLARDRSLQRPEAGDVVAMREALDRFIGDHPGFVWAGLVGLDGRVLAGSRGWLEGQSVAARPVFSETRTGLHVGEPHPAVLLSPLMREVGIAEQQLVDIGEQVLDANGVPVAVLATHLGVAWVDGLVRSVVTDAQSLHEGLHARVLADGGAQVMAATRDAAMASAASAFAPGHRLLSASRDVPFLPPLDRLRWRVVVEQDLAAALAPGRRMLQSIGALGLLAAALVAALGMLGARRMTRPWRPVLDAVAERHAVEGPARGLSLVQVVEEIQAELQAGRGASGPGDDSAAETLVMRLARDAGQLKRVIDHLPDAVAVVDAQGCIEYVNTAFSARLGWPAQAVVGRPEAELLLGPRGAPPGPGAAEVRSVRTLEGTELPVRWHRLPLSTGAGDTAAAAPPAASPGRSSGWLSVIQDLQAEVQARARAGALAAQLTALAEAATDVVLVTLDGAGRVLEWNRGAERLSGRRACDAIGCDLALLLWPGRDGPAAHEAWRPDWAALKREAQPLRVARWALGPDDSRFWGQGTLYALPADADPAAFGLLLRDATTEHEANRRLAESEARLASAVEAAALGTWSYDVVTRESQWNAQEYELLGLPIGDGRATPEMFYRFVHPQDLPELLRLVDQAVATGQPFEHAWRIERADGSQRWVAGRGQVLRDEDGRVVAMAGVNFDITRRHESERALSDSQARLAAIVGGASDAIVSIDDAGRITLFNPAAEAIFGWPSAQMLGEPLDRLLPPATRGLHQQLVQRFGHADAAAGAGAGRIRRTAVRGLTASGEVLELEASISRASVGGREVYTSILRDVTERRVQERALAKTRQELGELTIRLLQQEKQTTRQLAQVLHDELGQTLTAIRLHLDAHAALPALPAEPRERISHLVDQAHRQVRHVLTDLRPPLLDEHGLVPALDNEVKQLRPAGGRPTVRLDPAMGVASRRWPSDVEYAAFMIAREAVLNALRHAQAERIVIAVEGDAGELWLTVSDDGIGLAPQDREPRPGHLGLIGMRERALAIGASLTLTSAGPQARGTYVNLSWSHARLAAAGHAEIEP